MCVCVMAPVPKTEDKSVDVRESVETETVAGCHSASVNKVEVKCEEVAPPKAEVTNGDSEGTNSTSHDATDGNKSQSQTQSRSEVKDASTRQERDKSVERKAESLAQFVVFSVVGKRNTNTDDKVEQTLLRCVRMMMQRHEILLKGMMKRLDITRETGYVSFVAVANELFEGGKMAITWARIVALYAFGGQLALYCKEKNMEDFCAKIALFMGQYASEVVAPFVRKSGGWIKICEEFPVEEDLESKAWRYLTWTAIGLGLAATASFFTSH